MRCSTSTMQDYVLINCPQFFREHLPTCKSRLETSHLIIGGLKGIGGGIENDNGEEDVEEKCEINDGEQRALQIFQADLTMEESLYAERSNILKSLDDSIEGLSETLNETTFSSDDISQSVLKKEKSLEGFSSQDYQNEIENAEKLSHPGALEDTGDIEDDAVAVTDEILPNSGGCGESQVDEEKESEDDAVEVTDETCAPNSYVESVEELLKSRQASPDFEDKILIPSTSNANFDDISSQNIEMKKESESITPVGLEAENTLTLYEIRKSEAETRLAEATRLHMEVLRQPGCPKTGDFCKAFGICANSIEVMHFSFKHVSEVSTS